MQAKYLAQIIVMGAQVVGRAFARALKQEYAGMIYNFKSNICNSIYLINRLVDNIKFLFARSR